MIARFQSLLVDATAFQDIVEIERVISERTISLEQLLASQRNLDNRVERSTLTIQLQYETPVAEVAVDDSTESIADAWRAGWDVFVGALFAIGYVLAVAAPFILTAALVLGAVWLATRRLRGTGRNASTATRIPAASAVAEAGDEALTSEETLAGPTPRG